MSRYVAGSLYVAVTVALAAVAAWPIYQSGAFLLLVVVSAALAAAIAAFVRWRRAGGWMASGLLAAAVLVVGVPLAVPTRMSDPASFVRGLGELGAGIVVGWKDLLTVDLPVGSYRNLLVPALIVFLAGTCAALLLSWRDDAAATVAVPVSIAMTGFGLLFGNTVVSAPIALGALTLYAPVETVVGLGTLATGVLWLSWRSREARARALRQAALSSGVRIRRGSGRDARRLGLGFAMVAFATVVALAVPAAAMSAERTVLRQATGPRMEISRSVSPLSAYRAMFTDAEYGQVLFRVAGARLPERIRLAVLDDYDGAVYRTGTGPDATSFVRLASGRPLSAGVPLDVEVTVGGLDGIWMPSAGTLASVSFSGSRAAALADGFYVNDDLEAAVQTAGWRQGDTYRLEGAAPDARPLGEVTAPGGGGAADGAPEVPASLRTWMQEHVAGTGGAALEGLVTLLRERGYLSHSLTDAQTAWMSDAGVDTFVPSAAGHSLSRIDQLFTALLEREQDPRATASGNFVAAIGDDEQFSVAVALMARELGFPARVVVGARTSAADPSLSVCQTGTCLADDLSAWVEVRSSAGQWIPVDVTPQRSQAPSREVTAQPDPTIGTEVRPDVVDEVEPPHPAQEDNPSSVDRPDAVDLAWLWATLRIGGLALGAAAIVLGPFLLVVTAKALRRRARRTAAAPADRIAGGWEEYLDAAADAGRRGHAVGTRVEIAAALDMPAADGLARSADEAVFSSVATSEEEAGEFWHIVDAERREFAQTRWQRLRAAVSVRSFVPGGLRRSLIRRGSLSRTGNPSRTGKGGRARTGARHTA